MCSPFLLNNATQSSATGSLGHSTVFEWLSGLPSSVYVNTDVDNADASDTLQLADPCARDA